MSPFAERGAFSDECLRLIKALWTQEKVSFEGRYFNFADMQASPRPLQHPHPPIWVGGNSPRARRRVAEFGDGWHATAMPLDELKAGIADVRHKWVRQGRAGEPVFSMRIPCSIEGVSQEVLHYPPRRPSQERLTGSISSIVDRLGAYQELGLSHLALEMSTQSHEATFASLEALRKPHPPATQGINYRLSAMRPSIVGEASDRRYDSFGRFIAALLPQELLQFLDQLVTAR